MSYSATIHYGTELYNCYMHQDLPTVETLEDLLRCITVQYNVSISNLTVKNDSIVFKRVEKYFKDDFDPTLVDTVVYYKIYVWHTERVRSNELKECLCAK